MQFMKSLVDSWSESCLRGELGHLGDASGVVAHGAVCVDGQARRERRQHADRGEGNTCTTEE